MVKQHAKKAGSHNPMTEKQVLRDVKNRALVWQLHRSKAGLLLGLALFAASAPRAWADAIENLQGSWVMENSECTGVFEKIGGQIQFKDLSFADFGFVISGKKVTGPIGGCTISQVKEENDSFSALLSCADAVAGVSKKFSMTFRVIDATHFERLNVNDDLVITYKKCSF